MITFSPLQKINVQKIQQQKPQPALTETKGFKEKNNTLNASLPTLSYLHPSFLGTQKSFKSLPLKEQLEEIKNAGNTGIDFGNLNVSASKGEDDRGTPCLILSYAAKDDKSSNKMPIADFYLDESREKTTQKVYFHDVYHCAAAVNAFVGEISPPYCQEGFYYGMENTLAAVSSQEVSLAKLMGAEKYLSQKSENQLLIEEIATKGDEGQKFGDFTVIAKPTKEGYQLDYTLANRKLLSLDWEFSGRKSLQSFIEDPIATRYVKAFQSDDLPFKKYIEKHMPDVKPNDAFLAEIKKRGGEDFAKIMTAADGLKAEMIENPEGLKFGDVRIKGAINKQKPDSIEMTYFYKDFPFLEMSMHKDSFKSGLSREYCSSNELNAIIASSPDDLLFKTSLIPNFMKKKMSPEQIDHALQHFVEKKSFYSKLMDVLSEDKGKMLDFGDTTICLQPDREGVPKLRYSYKGVDFCDLYFNNLEPGVAIPLLKKSDVLSLLAYDTPDDLLLKNKLLHSINMFNTPIKRVPAETIVKKATQMKEELNKLEQKSLYGKIQVIRDPETSSILFSLEGKELLRMRLNGLEPDYLLAKSPLSHIIKAFETKGSDDLPLKTCIYEMEDLSPQEITDIMQLEETTQAKKATLKPLIDGTLRKIEALSTQIGSTEKGSPQLEALFKAVPNVLTQFSSVMPYVDVPTADNERIKAFATSGDTPTQARELDLLETYIKRKFCYNTLKKIDNCLDKCPNESLKASITNQLETAEDSLKLIGLTEHSKEVVNTFKTEHGINFHTTNYDKLNDFFLDMVKCFKMSGLADVKDVNLHYYEGFRQFGDGVVALAGDTYIAVNPKSVIREIRENQTKHLWTIIRHELGHIAHLQTVDREHRGFYDKYIPISFLNKEDMATLGQFVEAAKEKGLFEEGESFDPTSLEDLCRIKNRYLDKGIEEKILPNDQLEKVSKSFTNLFASYDSYLSLLEDNQIDAFKDFAVSVHENIEDVKAIAGSNNKNDFIYGFFNDLTSTINFIDQYLPKVEKEKYLPDQQIEALKMAKVKLNHINDLVNTALEGDFDISHAKRSLRELIAKTVEHDNYRYFDPEYLDLVDSIGYPHPKDRVDI